jgi:hypothetical protein
VGACDPLLDDATGRRGVGAGLAGPRAGARSDPTIGWVTWHIGWWWTVTIDHAPGWAPRNRGEIRWPGEGPATIGWLRGLRRDWLAVLEHLTDADLDVTAPFPWHNNPERTVAHMVSWVNSELMKNTAEIGQLRLLHAATAE